MTTATMSHANAASYRAPSVARPALRTVSVVKARPAFSASEFFAMLQQTFAMARSVPDVGRISAKDVERIRAMFDVK